MNESERLIKQYNKERDYVMLHGDINAYRLHCRKWNIPYSDDDIIAQATIYKCILLMKNPPMFKVTEARMWLKEHGFKEGIQ